MFWSLELSGSGFESISILEKGRSVLVKRIMELLSKMSNVLLKGK